MLLSLEAGGSTNTRRGGGDGEDLGGSGRGGGGYHWTRVEVGMTSGGSMEDLGESIEALAQRKMTTDNASCRQRVSASSCNGEQPARTRLRSTRISD